MMDGNEIREQIKAVRERERISEKEKRMGLSITK